MGLAKASQENGREETTFSNGGVWGREPIKDWRPEDPDDPPCGQLKF